MYAMFGHREQSTCALLSITMGGSLPKISPNHCSRIATNMSIVILVYKRRQQNLMVDGSLRVCHRKSDSLSCLCTDWSDCPGFCYQCQETSVSSWCCDQDLEAEKRNWASSMISCVVQALAGIRCLKSNQAADLHPILSEVIGSGRDASLLTLSLLSRMWLVWAMTPAISFFFASRDLASFLWMSSNTSLSRRKLSMPVRSTWNAALPCRFRPCCPSLDQYRHSTQFLGRLRRPS